MPPVLTSAVAMENFELTSLVLRYQRGEVEYSEISGRISLFVYDYPRRLKRWSQDLCSDFFEFFYPRIKSLADSYKSIGFTFESYLSATIKQQIKTFLKKRKEEEQRDRIYSQMCIHEYKISSDFGCSHVAEGESSYCVGNTGQSRTRRRLLFLAFTDPEHLDDSTLQRLSEAVGCTVEYLHSRCLRLKERIQDKQEALRELAEKKNAQYFRLLMLQSEVSNESADDRRSLLIDRIGKVQRRIDSLARQMEIKKNRLVTHEDLAWVFGISKGTVDSGIFYLKKKKITLSADTQSLR